ncbi:MAG: hypothetical protein SFU25_03310 [Candidatus Caenarcaniphilales bacterium]|nr:hypothetical protein [Candidatus Caenarcaniphilales bacterium]
MSISNSLGLSPSFGVNSRPFTSFSPNNAFGGIDAGNAQPQVDRFQSSPERLTSTNQQWDSTDDRYLDGILKLAGFDGGDPTSFFARAQDLSNSVFSGSDFRPLTDVNGNRLSLLGNVPIGGSTGSDVHDVGNLESAINIMGSEIVSLTDFQTRLTTFDAEGISNVLQKRNIPRAQADQMGQLLWQWIQRNKAALSTEILNQTRILKNTQEYLRSSITMKDAMHTKYQERINKVIQGIGGGGQ